MIRKMYYVYMENVETGKQDLVGGNFRGVYEDFKSAVECVATLYAMDSKSPFSKNKYYYFIKKH